MVFLYRCRENDYLRFLEQKRIDPRDPDLIEYDFFGLNHQALGAAVLAKWGLPETIFSPIRFHHSPREAPDALRTACEILAMAHCISEIYHGTSSAKNLQKLKDIFKQRHAVDASKVDTLIDQVAEKTLVMLSFFDLSPGEMKPYTQLLQEANTELRKLNLTYEQLVFEYKHAKESAEKLARELQEANQKLRRLATTDGLTGLFNHRAFQELLEKRIREANRHRRSLSLVILDLDHFKCVNDTYGHPAGDAVLQVVSNKISKIMRVEDILARYGGEEFAVILPETDIEGAIELSERIRSTIASEVINIKGNKLGVTISLGVSAKAANQTQCMKQWLIDTADKALYQAKRNGRNTVQAAKQTQPFNRSNQFNKALAIE